MVLNVWPKGKSSLHWVRLLGTERGIERVLRDYRLLSGASSSRAAPESDGSKSRQAKVGSGQSVGGGGHRNTGGLRICG